jgi:hypothetical protein
MKKHGCLFNDHLGQPLANTPEKLTSGCAVRKDQYEPPKREAG